MIKPDRWIREWGRGGGVTPFEESQVNSASYDVRVSDHWICPTRDPEEFRAPRIKLFPGEVVLASTIEHVRIPRTVACDLKLKSRVLVPSSAMVYAASDSAISEEHDIAPGSPYALSKLAQELVGTGNPGGPDVFIARAFNHFGPRQDPWFVASGFARRIADIEAGRWAPEIAVGNLESKRDLMDVRDTVRAYRLIIERGVPGRPYNVCTGRALAIHDLLHMMLARARVPIAVKTDPARYRPNDQPIVLGDPRRIQDELGWRAEIPVERTIDDLLAFWRDRNA